MRFTAPAILGVLLAAGCATARRPNAFAPVLPASSGIVATALTCDGLNADCFYRPSNKPRRALILLGGSEGGKSWSSQTPHIEQLVDAGYYVLSVAYFGAEGLPGDLRAIPLEYFAKVFRWLSVQKGIVPDDYVVMGVSRGAELALLLASVYPQVKAVVAIAPSSVVFPGPPTGILDALRGQHSAWSLGGQEVPFLRIPFSLTTLRGLMSGNRTRMFEKALSNAHGVEKAAIRAERAHGPILLISFTQDQIWPSTLMSEQLTRRLAANGFGFQCQHRAYARKHSDWSFGPCWTSILDFLREQCETTDRIIGIERCGGLWLLAWTIEN
jgi:pimeloyl-ACP methyl ester carboxylesterase